MGKTKTAAPAVEGLPSTTFNDASFLTVPVTLNGVKFPFDVKKPGDLFNSTMAEFETLAQDEGERVEELRKKGEKLERELHDLQADVDGRKPRSKSAKESLEADKAEIAEMTALLDSWAAEIEDYNNRALALGKKIIKALSAKPAQFEAIMEAYEWRLVDLMSLLGGFMQEADKLFGSSEDDGKKKRDIYREKEKDIATLVQSGFEEKRVRSFGPYRRLVLLEVVEAIRIDRMIDDLQMSELAALAARGGKEASKAANLSKGELTRYRNELMNRTEAVREEARKRIMEEANQNWGAMQEQAGLKDAGQQPDSPMAMAFRAARERNQQLQKIQSGT